MIEKMSLGLEEAQRAIAAIFEQAEKEGRPLAAAITDNNGDLISCARMDGAHARVLQHAIRKAHTAAIMARDTVTFQKTMQQRGRTLADYGDPSLTSLQGGLVIVSGGQVVGGIGSGGSSHMRDVDMARMGMQAMGIPLD